MAEYDKTLMREYVILLGRQDFKALATFALERVIECQRSRARLTKDAARRRARSPEDLTPHLRALVMERDDFRCRRCGAGPADDRLVIDHIVPITMGGTNDFGNLQTLCNTCNSGKADREPHPSEIRD